MNPPPSIEEIQLLVELRERISDLDLSSDDLEDKNLVRFLRARNGDLEQTEVMIRNNYAWQVTEDIKSLLAEYECPKGWDEDFPIGFSGFDRTGCPILFSPIGTWDVQKETAQGNKEEIVKFCYFTLEKLMTFTKHLSKDEKHIKQVVGIVDLKGLSFRQVTSIDVVEAVIRILKAYEANYPETVKTAVILNAPWPFQIIWRLITPFVSERTHSKLAFLGGDKEKWREALFELAQPDQFPACYGGTGSDSSTYFIGRDGSWSKSENQNGIIKYENSE